MCSIRIRTERLRGMGGIIRGSSMGLSQFDGTVHAACAAAVACARWYDAAVPVAVLSDIHGNLPALEAVLEEVRAAHVDGIIVPGDLYPGPMPADTMTTLLEFGLPLQFIYGNGDREVLARVNGVDTEWYRKAPEQWRAPIRWTAEQLPREHAQMLASWPPTRRIDVPGVGSVFVCHATPRNEDDIFTRLTPEDRLMPLFAGLDAALVLCGHTHMTFDRRIGGVRVVNAGSVGMPFGEPGADWVLLGPDVQFRHTAYDRSRAAERIRATSYPGADEFASSYVLEPPTEAAMLEAFTSATFR
jgi:putative phosphoesterase